jgi:DNA invertase Pin-like site-specific DNA recombinase/predicted DNA-binding transcriptional regulator AlpA
VNASSGPAAQKITPSHLGRDAYVYIRQSTQAQVTVNTESLARQYELAERAGQLGWHADQVVTIDADLGRSGARSDGRPGFRELVADVGLGKAGIVLGIEVSRLARNNADWYQLLDLCALTDTLIADADGIYHPGDFNDRLVLGLKGTMSEAELHLIRSRLTLGLQHKAAKGELKIPLPVGLDYDEDGRVAVSADEAVREAVGCIFRRFTELGSARQVMLSLLDDGVLLPRRSSGVSGKVTWLKASYQAVQHTLRNPAYAGAFVFGQTRTEKHLDAGGRLITRTRALPMQEWAVLIRGHHPGYVTWDQYEANLKVLAANRRPAAGQGGGALREGPALLQGLIRCGKCSRVMRTRYSGGAPGRPGSSPRHECVKAKLHFGAERTCQSVGGRKVEKLVLDQLFQVLEPASLAATAKAMTEAEQHWRASLAVFETAVERARFDADRAMRQYDAVEPENRLVARTLERTLEARLATLRRAEHDLAAQRTRRPVNLTPDELDWITRAGADVKAVFHAPTTTLRERKQLIRAVISEIVLTVEDARRTAEVTIVWQGGATSTGTILMNRPGAGHDNTLPDDTAELIGRLARHYDDSTIAHVLAQQRRTTGTGLRWTKTRVASQRFRLGIPAYNPDSRNVSADDQDTTVATITEAEKILGIPRITLYRWLREGFIVGEQIIPGAPWHIRIDQALRDKVKPQAPDGWLPVDQAAKALGLSRTTVFQKVRDGQLPAIHVSNGQRQSLRIQVKHQAAGLFDTPQ